MSKQIKVSDSTHALLTEMRAPTETIEDVILRNINNDTPTENELLEAGKELVLAIREAKKIIAEGKPSTIEQPKPAGRKTAGLKLPDNKPAQEEMECCTGVNPCRHWTWNTDIAMYRNSLSGRTREAVE